MATRKARSRSSRPPAPEILAKPIAKKCEQLGLTSADQLNKLVDLLVILTDGSPALDSIEALTEKDARCALIEHAPASPFFALWARGDVSRRELVRLEKIAMKLSRAAVPFFSPAKGVAKWVS
jgi:hypothetical protein